MLPTNEPVILSKVILFSEPHSRTTCYYHSRNGLKKKSNSKNKKANSNGIEIEIPITVKAILLRYVLSSFIPAILSGD